jgi:Ser/Thr protein kinase RdoA (MazF antagonist)
MALLQRAAEGFDRPGRTCLLTTSWPPDVPARVAADPRLADALRGRPWERDVEQVLGPLLDGLPELPPSWTHGDGSPTNLLWSGDGDVSAVLDLGLCDRTSPVVELATALERSGIAWLEDPPRARPEVVMSLVAGWTEVLPVDADALRAVLPLVHVGFALSETAYFASITGSAADAEVAYETYLLGHARWWQSPAGQALLEGSRRAESL